MRELPAIPRGVHLDVDEYYHDFEPRFWNIREHDFWKLERKQHFQEDGSPSWDAFTRGDWNKALHLIAERKPSLTEYYDRVARHGFTTYRVRVVGDPITPYLQWELNSLLQRAETGERVRVAGADDIADFEQENELPEIVTVGTEAVYQVIYDDDGILQGATRSLHPDDVTAWREFIQELYADGEDITEFHRRKVAAMPPPHMH